ncbi:hypothetical protein [Mucilaginibacter sp. UR6-11]|uniref:hypothetical protein n=1 Tax=Mucilaginibacter sp. UR6-11 TaxID=1435644 RepID=UPI001E4D9CC9|nr:hypothetical protein [Mucilaginibacter sp. UR6-11]MCC8423923.1 hypothetical protein [Mucilaginibacter sp. UR6-11]
MARDIENKEWLNDYARLKQVSTKNPFTVPDSYFEGLDERIISAIKLDELKNSISPDCFVVPENYFEELGSNIKSRIAIEEILDTTATGLTVPENYFGELSGNIQSRIAIEELTGREAAGLTVPENYFEQLSSNIQSRIAVEELLNNEDTGLTVPANYFEDLSSKIRSRLVVEEALANAEDAFTVPQDYFNRLNQNILNKTVNQDIVKRKSAVIRVLSSTAFKYATAACFVAMIGTGVFLQMESPEAVHDRSFLHKELSTIPVTDIQNYLEQNVDGSDTQHTVANENLPVSPDELKAALQDYTDQ